jgi:hypothetical protein
MQDKNKEIDEKGFYGCFLILTGLIPLIFGTGELINAIFFEKVKLFGISGDIGLALMSLLGLLMIANGVADMIDVWKNLR